MSISGRSFLFLTYKIPYTSSRYSLTTVDLNYRNSKEQKTNQWLNTSIAAFFSFQTRLLWYVLPFLCSDFKEIIKDMIFPLFSFHFLFLLSKIVHYINNFLKVRVLWIARNITVWLGNVTWDPESWLFCIDLVTGHLSTQCPFAL